MLEPSSQDLPLVGQTDSPVPKLTLLVELVLRYQAGQGQNDALITLQCLLRNQPINGLYIAVFVC